MVIIGDVFCASEDGANEYAHDHQEPINDRVVDLTHPSLGSVDYLKPQEATKSHGFLTHEKVAEIMAWLAAKVSIISKETNFNQVI